MVVEILSRYVGISVHHVVFLKYIIIVFVNYTSVIQGREKEIKYCESLNLDFPFQDCFGYYASFEFPHKC